YCAKRNTRGRRAIRIITKNKSYKELEKMPRGNSSYGKGFHTGHSKGLNEGFKKGHDAGSKGGIIKGIVGTLGTIVVGGAIAVLSQVIGNRGR
ncbi:MAG: hypothetical protein IKY83_04070, partial [Proteobacteria bacterium]|nr:hypothetical protein [Pseudomonadota bacterium]